MLCSRRRSKLKVMIKNYYKPTPVKLRKFGDALLAISMLGVPAELTGHTYIAVSIFVCGVVGKFLTNFFTDEN
jgi:hypothetical protein